MEERRKYKRVTIEGIDIHCKMMLVAEVGLINLSLGGASIRLNKRLNIGNEYTLKIDCADRIISLIGIVVWERLAYLRKNESDELAPIYEAGLKFNETLSGKGTELINFIEQNILGGTSDLRLLGTRVRIIKPEKTIILGHYKSFSVKTLSQGGILIETDQEYKKEERLQMELIFTELKESIKFLGRIASCLEISGRVPKFYDTGIEFIGMNEEDKSKLKGFIDSLKNQP